MPILFLILLHLKEMFLNAGTETVVDRQMKLLGLEGLGLGGFYADGGKLGEGATIFTCHRYHLHAETEGDLGGSVYVPCISRGADADEYITGLCKPEKSLGIDQLGILIVAEGCVEGGEGCQRYGGQTALKSRKQSVVKSGA